MRFSHVRRLGAHARAGRALARVLRHTAVDQTGLPCSVLCAVFPFKSGRLAHVGSLGFSCRQLSEPWQAVLTSGGVGELSAHIPTTPLATVLLYLILTNASVTFCAV